jgi:hypothetical protein
MIRYEDYVLENQKTMQRVAEFLGLKQDSSFLNEEFGKKLHFEPSKANLDEFLHSPQSKKLV